MVRYVYKVWPLLLIGTLALTACGNGGSAVETRDRREDASASVISTAIPDPAVPNGEGVSPDAPAAVGVVTSNRRETADAKAIRLFERNGYDFGAKDAQDYLDKAKAFTSKPPRDAEKVQRANGDTLIYQASSNTFAVTDARGVVRTMFKPSNGDEYWSREKAKALSGSR